MVFNEDEPCYTISVVARLIGVHAQTLRYYEREGLIRPSRSNGNIRLYSNRDLARVREIKTWVTQLGLNLAGVATMTRLRSRVSELQSEVNELREQVEEIRRALTEAQASSRARAGFDGETLSR
mgnify:FL=1